VTIKTSANDRFSNSKPKNSAKLKKIATQFRNPTGYACSATYFISMGKHSIRALTTIDALNSGSLLAECEAMKLPYAENTNVGCQLARTSECSTHSSSRTNEKSNRFRIARLPLKKITESNFISTSLAIHWSITSPKLKISTKHLTYNTTKNRPMFYGR
jgi:hypothetical protein